ncbi:MAG: corrinoid protein [Oscillospiraceae bacterium]|nr:corrinoid protein [Oscillospiraceae bacterium]
MPVEDLPAVPHRQRAKPVETGAPQVEAAVSDAVLTDMGEALCRGQKKKVAALCQKALDSGIEAQSIVTLGLMPGMNKLGEDFSAGRAFVPEMLMAARCMNAAMELLKPHLVGAAAASAGRVCLGTVRGDLHDIGKNLVKIMMEGAGLEVVDLGVDVAPEDFVRTAIEQNCGLIACSSLLTTAMNEMRSVVRLADEAGIRDKVKIMVGGAPISQSFCDEIGADAYTDDAATAARVAIGLLSA